MNLSLITLISLAATALGLPVIPENSKVLRFPTEVRNTDDDLVAKLQKRDGSILSVSTNIHQILLTYPLTIGGEVINAVVDTGSRSSWVLNGALSANANSALCLSDSCLTSTSELNVSNDEYAIYYRGDFGAFGTWATGSLSVSNSKDVSFKFGLASSTEGSTGGFSWSGFGYDSNELTHDSSTHVIDVLYEGGVIDKRVFQIEYDPLTDWAGNIMGQGTLTIGGYNTAKVTQFFDMTPNIKYYLAMPVQAISNSDGDSINLSGAQTAVFDSGSTSLLLKKEYYDAILGSIEFSSQYKNFFKCSDYQDFKITFDINGSNSITIPLTSISWNNYQETDDLCQLMVGILPDDVNFEIAFGQYAMKNLITVFDIDAKQLGIASNSEEVIFV